MNFIKEFGFENCFEHTDRTIVVGSHDLLDLSKNIAENVKVNVKMRSLSEELERVGAALPNEEL